MLTKEEFLEHLRETVRGSVDELTEAVDLLKKVRNTFGLTYYRKNGVSEEELYELMKFVGEARALTQKAYNNLDGSAIDYLEYKSGLKESRSRKGRLISEKYDYPSYGDESENGKISEDYPEKVEYFYKHFGNMGDFRDMVYAGELQIDNHDVIEPLGLLDEDEWEEINNNDGEGLLELLRQRVAERNGR